MNNKFEKIRRIVDVVSGATLTFITASTTLLTGFTETIVAAFAVFLIWTLFKLVFEESLIVWIVSKTSWEKPKENAQQNCRFFYDVIIKKVLEMEQSNINWENVEEDCYEKFVFSRQWLSVSDYIVWQFLDGNQVDVHQVSKIIQIFRNDTVYLHDLKVVVDCLLMCYEKMKTTCFSEKIYPYYSEIELKRLKKEYERVIDGFYKILETN